MGIIKWIKKGNDCSKCNYCWEEISNTDCGTEYDGGCYIKGCCYDDQPCYLLTPIKFILGFFKKKKSEYFLNHEYDNFGDWWTKKENNQDKFKQLMNKSFDGYSLCYKDADGTLNECNKELIINNSARDIINEYEDYAHPIIHKKLKNEWSELIKKTFNMFLDKFKPYFCK